MEGLSVLAVNLSVSNHSNIIHDSLSAFPNQKKVS